MDRLLEEVGEVYRDFCEENDRELDEEYVVDEGSNTKDDSAST